MPKRENDTVAEPDSLTLVFSGGLADVGSLLLPEYAASLNGWRDLFQTLGELYLHSFPELRRLRGSDLLRIEIVAERQGTYETVIAFFLGAATTGVIGNRVDAALVWTFRKLIEWYREAVTTYVRSKGQSTDYTQIAAALESMIQERGIVLDDEIDIVEDQLPLFDTTAEEEQSPQDEILRVDAPVAKATVLAERIDQALKQATQPLEQSCRAVSVETSAQEIIFEFGQAERAVILSPLTAPPPKRTWRTAKVKFERINRKTGKALFYFQGENDTHAAHYGHIVDPAVQKPHNRYTQAFNDDELLDVWLRQTHPEKGRLNLQWELTAEDPDKDGLFNMPLE